MYLLSRDAPSHPLKLSEFFGADIPHYAILSHTWGPDSEEVSFKDVRKSRGSEKSGYKKIQFCLDRAEADGLRYCWVDTCCIDKKNNNELSEAINSMFRWYRNAKKCYVYLTDVPSTNTFRTSRWFTRGWTLQELLAPKTVEFYMASGAFLGDKASLIEEVHEITEIPIEALEGCSLARFTFSEIVSWASNRQTKREEDKAYSLLGIFDVSMPLVYGETYRHAFIRLQKHIEESQMVQAGFSFESGGSGATNRFSVPFELPGVKSAILFIGRTKETSELEEALPLTGLRQSVVLHGMGGIGKTQLVLHYATRRQSEYSAIFWMNGSTEESLCQSFLAVSKRLRGRDPYSAMHHPVADSDTTSDAISSVMIWLGARGNDRWLLVLDGVDDPCIRGDVGGLYNVQSYIPTCAQGHVIITSRSPQIHVGRQIELKEIQDASACIAIIRISSGLRFRLPKQDAVISEISDPLEGLPLALTQAGLFLRNSPIKVSDYFQLYKLSWKTLQQNSSTPADYGGRALHTTWIPSLHRVQARSTSAVKLLQLFAYLDRKDLWFELLSAGREGAPAWFMSVTGTRAVFDDVMQILCNNSLVKSCGASGRYKMHACVHKWLQASDETDEEIPALALKCVSRLVPSEDERDYWVVQQRLLPHADQWIASMFTREWPVYQAPDDIEALGRLFQDQGRFSEAETMYSFVLSHQKQFPERNRLLIARTMCFLGALQHDQGKLAQSEEILTEALRLREIELHSMHDSVLETLVQLGLVYISRDKLFAAEEALTRAHSGYSTTHGPRSVSALRVAGSLGMLYDPSRNQGRDEACQSMYKESVEGLTAALGPNHPLTLTISAEWGYTRLISENDTTSESVLVQALDGLRESLGATHIKTLRALYYRGSVLRVQDKRSDCKEFFGDNLELVTKQLGHDHELTVCMVYRLAYSLSDEDPAKAKELFLKVIHERERALGKHHLLTLNASYELGRFYKNVRDSRRLG